MTVLPWVALLMVGLLVMVLASRRAVDDAVILARGLRVPAIVVGFTLMSVGTDLPEIANSIVASLAGHGDLNVGDSIGSAVTQATLVLGLLTLAGGAFRMRRGLALPLLLSTAGALILGVLLFMDGFISRTDAMVLILAWLATSVALWRRRPDEEAETVVSEDARGPLILPAARMLFWLALVGAGTGLMIAALIRLSAYWGMPEYVISFFIASIGTSLPELMVDLRAIRKGQADLALGDVLGSSFVDATLSVGAGPLIAPVAITADLAVRGSLGALVVFVVIGAMVLANRTVIDRRVGVALLVLYVMMYPLLLR